MWHYIDKLEYTFSSTVSRMDTRDWIVFLGVVVVLGILCMRGYGSRRY